MKWGLKRGFDLSVATIGLAVAVPILIPMIFACRISTGTSGIYRQTRIGRDGQPFTIYKLRTMRMASGGTITTESDTRITPLGRWVRRTKLDELPQLWNVIRGDMSLVGPRPDVPGYADKLTGSDRRLWQLRPGITGPASLKYRNEEQLLATKPNPQAFNDTVIWPDKVKINLHYLDQWSFRNDLRILRQTVLDL